MEDLGHRSIIFKARMSIPRKRDTADFDHSLKPFRRTMFSVAAEDAEPTPVLKVPVHAGAAVGAGGRMSGFLMLSHFVHRSFFCSLGNRQRGTAIPFSPGLSRMSQIRFNANSAS